MYSNAMGDMCGSW